MADIDFDYFYKRSFSPLLKWPGGKKNDLKQIKENFSYLLPNKIKNYYEPFLGGGAVWLSLHADKMYVNDLCEEVILLHEFIRDKNDDFLQCIQKMTENWNYLAKVAQDIYKELYLATDPAKKKLLEKYQKDIEQSFFMTGYKKEYFNILLSSLVSKVKNIQKIEANKGQLTDADLVQNIEGALKAGFYTTVRKIYNTHSKMDFIRAACFYILRDYCFSSMFRYNSKGGFNVPYGGLSYNDRSPDSRVKYWGNDDLQKHLKATQFYKMDFEKFLRKLKPGSDDFIFVDPPYDSKFSTYAKNEFGEEDQKRLATYLIKECQAKFLAIMKNTPFIRGLYEGKSRDIQCLTFDKTYAVSFKDRNDRSVEHLIVSRT